MRISDWSSDGCSSDLTQSGQIEQLKTDASSIREQLTSEIKSRESAQIALGKAELRIESIPSLTEDLKQARAEAKSAGQEAAELRGKLAGMEQVKSRKD